MSIDGGEVIASCIGNGKLYGVGLDCPDEVRAMTRQQHVKAELLLQQHNHLGQSDCFPICFRLDCVKTGGESDVVFSPTPANLLGLTLL